MIQKKHFHILDALSVLMFAVLANFIFGLKIDFCQQINWIQVTQLIILASSAFIFYFMVYKLKNLHEEAEKDYNAETVLKKKATNSIEMRYKTNYDKTKNRIRLMLYTSIVFSILFFLIEPLCHLFMKMYS